MRRVFARVNYAHPIESTDIPVALDPRWFTRSDFETDLPQLITAAWRSRSDLQKAFSLETSAGRDGFITWFGYQGKEQFGIPAEIVDECIASARTRLSGRNGTTKLQSVFAKGATRMLSASPSLRPLYKHVPEGIRSTIKTSLYQTSARGGNGQLAALSVENASGTFDQARKPGVHFYGYCRSQSGIGSGARGFVDILTTLDVPMAASCFENPGDNREQHPFTEIKAPAAGYRISLIDANAEQMMSLEELVSPRAIKGTYRIAHWVWELETFPDAWAPALKKIDEVWVPSTFVATALREITQKPVHVIPHSVDQETVPDVSAQQFGLPGDRPIYLTAFDVNSFIERKNPHAVVRAFKDAFSIREDSSRPCLAVRIHGWHDGYKDTLRTLIGDDPDIFIIDQPLNRNQYRALQSLADVFVSLHRSEGFGLNMAEVMGLGKPVVATAWSGNLDFMDDDCAVLIPFALTPVPDGAYPHGQGQRWATPNHDTAVDAMRRLYREHDLRRSLGIAARDRIAAHCARAPVSRLVADRLTAIDGALSDYHRQ